jgi:hypothetical protein
MAKPTGLPVHLYFFLISRAPVSHRFLTRRRLFAYLLDRHERERPMLDLVLLASGLAFFALSIGYAYACDRL